MKEKKYLEGSYTIEAAAVLSLVFFSLAAMVQWAYGIHNQTVARAVLHEIVEAARHEKELTIEEAASLARQQIGLVRFELAEESGKIIGSAETETWNQTIEGRKFRPEEFLRKITLLEQLGENNGDSI